LSFVANLRALKLVPVALLAFASTAWAQAFSDRNSGFSITPPAPYFAKASRRPQFDVGASIQSKTGFPPIAGNSGSVCEAGFNATSANQGMSPAALRKAIESKEWRSVARSSIAILFQIQSERLFTLQGYRGIEFAVIPKAGPDAANARLLLSIVETARGRVTLICGTTRSAYPRARFGFNSIRSSINLPK
jgi:hypothetical protein